mmetsp:Transcript_25838/g.86608  ORF Transcript_25838/g.86608 Transcript_25838/m.86608 type:complete len:95 (-) Transcript_25838:539-823(-)
MVGSRSELGRRLVSRHRPRGNSWQARRRTESMPLQSSVPFMIITGILGVTTGLIPVAHYLLTGEKRRTMVDEWDRKLFQRDRKIDRMRAAKEID